MANRIHELKQNSMTFEARGLITGTKSKNFYKSDTSKNGNAWNELNFGLTVAPQKTIWLKLKGFEQKEVFYFERVKKGEKGNTKKVAWKDRKKSPGDNYRLIGVNISIDKDADNHNINEVMVPFDAIEHLHKNLQDGESFFVKGDIVPSSFVNKDGNASHKIDLIPNQMSFTDSPINFDAENFIPKADINIAPLIFASIDKEMDENDKHTGRFILQGYSVQYNAIEMMDFVMEAQDAAFAAKIKKKMKPGNAMTMMGNIEVVHDVAVVDEEDDWNVQRKSPLNRVNSRSHYEYVIYDTKGDFDKETYSEDSIAAAIKAIKQSKEASQKFADSNDNEEEVDWTKDDDTPFDVEEEWDD